jgi:hypothetical protein
MASRYYVLVREQNGDEVGRIYSDDPAFKSLWYTKIKNGVGQFRFECSGDHEMVSAFRELRAPVEVWRRNQDFGIDWGTEPEWEGFALSPLDYATESGQEYFVVNGQSCLDLADGVDIAYIEGTTYTKKTGPGETVIKAYVDENIGPGAADPNRFYDTSIAGLSIEADAARGGDWTGDRAHQDLLPVIQRIADQTGLAFDIVSTAPAEYEFRVYEGQRGSDRSDIGVDAANEGKNAAGNRPVIFSLAFDNIVEPFVSLARGASINIVHALGSGKGSAQKRRTAVDAASLAESGFHRREVVRSFSQENTDAGLDAAAESVIEEHAPGYAFNFRLRETADIAYGRDFFWGDKCVGQFGNINAIKELVFLSMTLNDRGEQMVWEFADNAQRVMDSDPELRQVSAVNKLTDRVDTLESNKSSPTHSTANVSNPPTDAQLDAAFGTPAQVGAGFMATLDDNGAHANEYLVWSDGSNWWYATGAKAV